MKVRTKLVGKEGSPLVIRRFTTPAGVPCFVALITDDDLSSLDEVVTTFFKEAPLENQIEVAL